MNITEVRVKLMSNRRDKLQAFCSVTLDNDFVIRDLKIIEGTNGHFVAMPSRKLADKCPKCSTKNHLRANFCNECGAKLPGDRVSRDSKGRAKLHVDIAHPINIECRSDLQRRSLEAFYAEVERAKSEDYVAPDDVAVNSFDSSPDDPAETKPAESGGYDGGDDESREAELDAELDGSLHDSKHIPSRNRDEAEDNFGSGIFT